MRTCQVGEDVIGNDERAWQQKPDDAIENIGHKEGRGYEDEEQDEVRPCILLELVQVVALLQPQHKAHKACARHTASVCIAAARLSGAETALCQC